MQKAEHMSPAVRSLVWFVVVVVAAISSAAAMATVPSQVFVYDFDSNPGNRNQLMTSLAGIVNRTQPEIFLAKNNSSSSNNPYFWLDQHLVDYPSTVVLPNNTTAFYINNFAHKIVGFVVYDDSTINQATSMAGALGGIMVHEALMTGPIATTLANNNLQQIGDVRNMSERDVYLAHASLFNKNVMMRLSPNRRIELRDLAILNGAFVFDDPGTGNVNRNLYLSGQNNHSLVLGWSSQGEQEFFRSVSDNNLMAVPADWLRSSSAPAQWGIDVPQQPGHTHPGTPTVPNKHYVAFVMSDGDNIQHLTNNAADARWYGSPHRGKFAMNFDMSPALAKFHPTAMKWYYDQAASDDKKTFFLAAGGEGLNFPSRLSDIQGFMDATVAAMTEADHNIISVLDENYNLTKLRQMVERPEVMGLMYKTWASAYKGRNGAIDWHQGKPIVSVKYSLWDGFDTPNSIINALNGAPKAPLTNQASYSIVNVHPWSTSLSGGGQGDPMSNINYIVQNLSSSVEVVTLEELFIHLRRNFGTPVDIPPLEGDFNGDGIVDASDYVLWRAQNGTSDEYNAWRRNFDATMNTASSGGQLGGAAVPEPKSMFILLGCALVKTLIIGRVRGCTRTQSRSA